MLELSIALSYFFYSYAMFMHHDHKYNAIMFELRIAPFYFFTAKRCLGNDSKTATGKAHGFGAVYD